ncbi:hypothetical protein AB1Y20_010439 [Prymnesium parvum]|uniref:Procollagen-proline 3-dioxygenase n=1 Tax=Prymnesium parvum TaxID=97485 RepID=A0AB34IS86_PRYPA
MAALLLPLAAAAASMTSQRTECPAPHDLEIELTRSSVDTLIRFLRSCSRMAHSQEKLIADVRTMLSDTTLVGSGEPGTFGHERTDHGSTDLRGLAGQLSHADRPTESSGLRGGASTKTLTTWHASEEDQRAAQAAQRELIDRRSGMGRPFKLITAATDFGRRIWKVRCDDRLYRLGLAPVVQCTPSGGPSGSLEDGKAVEIDQNGSSSTFHPLRGGCGRVLHDGFLSQSEQLHLIALVEDSMRGMYHQVYEGAQTSFAAGAASAKKQLGSMGVALVDEIIRRVMDTIKRDFGISQIFSAGLLFSRIWEDALIPADGMDAQPGHRYWNTHVDKANRASYDYSALLYLNSHCREASGTCIFDGITQPHFDGGLFSWMDAASDLTVEPRKGRLLTFTGGLENVHRITKVTRGTRYVIGMWFTCHEELRYVDALSAETQTKSEFLTDTARILQGVDDNGRVSIAPHPQVQRFVEEDRPLPVAPNRKGTQRSKKEGVPTIPPRRKGATRSHQEGVPAVPPRQKRQTRSQQEDLPTAPPRRNGALETQQNLKGEAEIALSGDVSQNSSPDYSYGLNDDLSFEEALNAYQTALRKYDEMYGLGVDNSEADLAVTQLHAESSRESSSNSIELLQISDEVKAANDNILKQPLSQKVNYDGKFERKDCGYPGITAKECVKERGCRWDDTKINVPWCFAS